MNPSKNNIPANSALNYTQVMVDITEYKMSLYGANQIQNLH